MVALLGTCYGYSVRSALPLHSLRSGEGYPLEVSELDYEFTPSGPPLRTWLFEGQPIAQAWAENGTVHMTIEDMGWFGIDAERQAITIPSKSSLVVREHRLWRLPVCLCFKQRGDLALHAAAAEVDGGAVILVGPTRHGKSTLAAGFVQGGHRLLAEDVSCVRPSSAPVVLPGPAQLRVRRDVYGHLELAGTRILAEWPDSVLLELAEERRGSGAPVPLRAIVFLRVGDGDAALTRRNTIDVARDLWAVATKLPAEDEHRHLFQSVVGLADSVPAWDLDRRLSLAELPDVVASIVDTCLR